MLCMAEEHPQARVIRSYLEQTERNAAWLARQIGESKQSVHAWLYEGRRPRSERMWAKMAAVLSQSLVREPPAAYSLSGISAMPTMKMPVLRSASGGDGDDVETNGFLEVPVQLNFPDYKAVELFGNSMEEHLKPGDILIFRQSPHPRVNAVTAVECGPEILVKQIVYEDGKYILHSFNPQYPDKPLPDDARVLGYLTAYYRDSFGEQVFRHNRSGLFF